MIGRLRESPLAAVGAFFTLTLSLSFGVGLSIAASTRGAGQSSLAETFAVVLLATPTIAAIVLTCATDGRIGLARLLGQLLVWRVPARWYLVALFLPATINLASIGVYAALGGSPPPIPGSVYPEFAPLVAGGGVGAAASISLYFLLASLAEEVGWRGYALPLLQSRVSALASSLVVGVVWALWHVPSTFLLAGTQSTVPFAWYVPSVLAIAVVFTWLYNNANGSLLLVTLLHASIQATNMLVPVLPSAADVRLYGLHVVVTIVAATVVVAVAGPRDHSGNRSWVTRP